MAQAAHPKMERKLPHLEFALRQRHPTGLRPCASCQICQPVSRPAGKKTKTKRRGSTCKSKPVVLKWVPCFLRRTPFCRGYSGTQTKKNDASARKRAPEGRFLASKRGAWLFHSSEVDGWAKGRGRLRVSLCLLLRLGKPSENSPN